MTPTPSLPAAIQTARDNIAAVRARGRWWVHGHPGGMHMVEADRTVARLRIELALTLMNHSESSIARILSTYAKSGGPWIDYVRKPTPKEKST
jgi:hypothetical protein